MQRGGAAVGLLEHLPLTESYQVKCLRLWAEGIEARGQIAEDFSYALGSKQGEAAFHSLEEFISLLAQFAHRPIIRHGVGCRCLGADESVITHLIAAAAEGQRNDAKLFAALVVRHLVVDRLCLRAEEIGMYFQILAQAQPQHTPKLIPRSATLH
ncbi:MAG: hypothetical protein ABJO27_27615 [Pseudoruegeria sp.]